MLRSPFSERFTLFEKGCSGGLLMSGRRPNSDSGEPDLCSNGSVFMGSKEPISVDPSPQIPLQQTTATAFLEKGEPFRERSPQHSISTTGLAPSASQPVGSSSLKFALLPPDSWLVDSAAHREYPRSV